jgi:hypothetical protein
MVCVCVPTTKHGTIVLEQGLRGTFDLMVEGIEGDEQNCTVRSCMVCTGE